MAVASSIRASCESSFQPQLTSMYGSENANQTYTSTYNSGIQVTLASGSPYTYANFSGGFPLGCDSVANDSCAPGDWSVIFGAFVNATDNPDGPWFLNIVDCLLMYGSVNISQQGGNSPEIVANSFQPNTSTIPSVPDSISTLRRIYTEDYGAASPYFFSGTPGTGDEADSLFQSPVATLLLHAKANSSAADVAQRIQQIFDSATLLAFSRSPASSDLITTLESSRLIYVFDRAVLAILAVPLIATLFGTFGRGRVTGKKCFVGYDPIEIARRGPVVGLSPHGAMAITADPGEGEASLMHRNRDEVDKLHVWAVQEMAEGEDTGSRIAKETLRCG